MKQTLVNYSVYFVLLPLLIFGVLFDPNGLSIGLKLWDAPTWISMVGEFLGHILWLLGILFGFIAYFLYTIGSDRELLRLSVYEKYKKGKTLTDFLKQAYGAQSRVHRTLTLSPAVLTLGSGYWFTGGTYLILILCASWLKGKQIRISRTIWKKFIKDTDGKTLPIEHKIHFNL